MDHLDIWPGPQVIIDGLAVGAKRSILWGIDVNAIPIGSVDRKTDGGEAYFFFIFRLADGGKHENNVDASTRRSALMSRFGAERRTWSDRDDQ